MMRYRKLGKIGMEASVIGLGAEHLDGKSYDIVKETFDAAIEHGINMVDVPLLHIEYIKNKRLYYNFSDFE